MSSDNRFPQCSAKDAGAARCDKPDGHAGYHANLGGRWARIGAQRCAAVNSKGDRCDWLEGHGQEHESHYYYDGEARASAPVAVARWVDMRLPHPIGPSAGIGALSPTTLAALMSRGTQLREAAKEEEAKAAAAIKAAGEAFPHLVYQCPAHGVTKDACCEAAIRCEKGIRCKRCTWFPADGHARGCAETAKMPEHWRCLAQGPRELLKTLGHGQTQCTRDDGHDNRHEIWLDGAMVFTWDDPPPLTVVEPSIDLVNHPPHYTSHPSGVECITVTEHMNFNIGNAVKYCWRAGLKDGVEALEDLKKARWYLTREVARLEKLSPIDRQDRQKKVRGQ